MLEDDQIEKLLGSRRSEERRDGVLALFRQRHADALPLLDEIRSKDPAPDVRHLARKAFDFLQIVGNRLPAAPPDDVDNILSGLGSLKEERRLQAIEQSVRSGDRRLAPGLIALLETEAAPRARYRILEYFSRHGQSQDVEPLMDALRDAHPEVRRRVLEVVVTLDPGGVDRVAKLIEEGSPMVATLVQQALEGAFADPASPVARGLGGPLEAAPPGASLERSAVMSVQRTAIRSAERGSVSYDGMRDPSGEKSASQPRPPQPIKLKVERPSPFIPAPIPDEAPAARGGGNRWLAAAAIAAFLAFVAPVIHHRFFRDPHHGTLAGPEHRLGSGARLRLPVGWTFTFKGESRIEAKGPGGTPDWPKTLRVSVIPRKLVEKSNQKGAQALRLSANGLSQEHAREMMKRKARLVEGPALELSSDGDDAYALYRAGFVRGQEPGWALGLLAFRGNQVLHFRAEGAGEDPAWADEADLIDMLDAALVIAAK